MKQGMWSVLSLLVVALVCVWAGPAEAKISKELKEELQPGIEAALENDDPLVKANAILAAGELNDRKLNKKLLPFLGSTNIQVRKAAIVALSSRKDKKGIESLKTEILKAGGGGAFVMGELTSKLPEAVQVAIFKEWIAGRKTDAKLRDLALQHVARFGNGKVYQLLEGAAKGRKAADRAPYLKALMANPRKEAKPWAEKLLGNKRDADARLEGLRLAMAIGGAEVDPIIRKALGDSDTRISGVALDYLAEAGDPSAGQFLIKQLAGAKDQLGVANRLLELKVKVPYGVAKSALDAAGKEPSPLTETLHAILGATQDPKALEALLALEGSTIIDERKLGIIGLAQTKSPKAAKVLERTANDGHRDIRMLSLKGLGTLGMASSVNVLYKAFNNARTDKEVRYAVVASMGQIKDSAAAQKLSFWIRDNDPKIKELAVEGLANIGDKQSITLLDTVITNERNADLKFKAFMIILAANKDAGMRHLTTVLQRPPQDYIDRFSELPSAARDEIFLTLLKHSKTQIRTDAMDGLMLMGQKGLGLVRKAASDSYPKDVRDAAIAELARHSDDADTNLFKRLAQAGSEDEKLMAMDWLIRKANSDLSGFFRTMMNGAKKDPALRMLAIYALLKSNA